MNDSWDNPLGDPFSCPQCGSEEFVPQWREGTEAEKKIGWYRLPVFEPADVTCAKCGARTLVNP